jgi:hypothetical protein
LAGGRWVGRGIFGFEDLADVRVGVRLGVADGVAEAVADGDAGSVDVTAGPGPIVSGCFDGRSRM